MPTTPKGDPQYAQGLALFIGGWMPLVAAGGMMNRNAGLWRFTTGLYGVAILLNALLVTRRQKGTIRYLLPRLQRARMTAVVIGSLMLAATAMPSVPLLGLPTHRWILAAALVLAGPLLWDTLGNMAEVAERWRRPRTARLCRVAAVVAPPLAVGQAAFGLWAISSRLLAVPIVFVTFSLLGLALFAPPLLLQSQRRGRNG